MGKIDSNEEKKGIYCELQETTFFTTGYFHKNGFCIPQIQNSLTLEEEIEGGGKEKKGYTIYSINDVLTHYKYPTKEEQLSNSDFSNILNTVLYSIKFMVTTTSDWFSAFLGVCEVTRNVYDLYAKASTKKLKSYRKILYELKGKLHEEEMSHKSQAKILAKKMKGLMDKETLNYKNKEADYYMHVYWDGDFQDQQQPVKHEINIVEHELSQRSYLILA